MIKKIGNVNIIDNDYVLKEECDLYETFNYLKSRGFTNYPNIIERNNNKNKYEFINDIRINYNQKAVDLIKILSLLHNKTSYTKEVSIDTYNEIINNLDGYVNYLNNYYHDMLLDYEKVIFPSPHQLLFISNYSKILEVIEFLKKDILEYKKMVENKHTTRVCLIHGKVNLDHILNDKLISWNNSKFESPIIDLIDLYHNEWERVNFLELLNIYLDKCKLNDDELKLLFISICIPIKIEVSDNEYENTIRVRKLYDYIYKCEQLIGPYYSKQDKE